MRPENGQDTGLYPSCTVQRRFLADGRSEEKSWREESAELSAHDGMEKSLVLPANLHEINAHTEVFPVSSGLQRALE